MLLHLTTLDGWLAHPDRPYATATLALDGFIHCSADEESALAVANARFARTPGPLMMLLIEETALDSAVRWEPAGDADPGDPEAPLFPHIYGPVNRSAVAGMLEVGRDAEGRWATLALWS
jgi:uncharacterized protein (DUF952 family)